MTVPLVIAVISMTLSVTAIVLSVLVAKRERTTRLLLYRFDKERFEAFHEERTFRNDQAIALWKALTHLSKATGQPIEVPDRENLN